MKKNFLFKANIVSVVFLVFFLQGCETLKGFSGKDKGSEKISQGFNRDLNNVWDKILDLDAFLREKLW